MNTQLITFGEPLIRMSVPRGVSMGETKSFEAYVGGSELNVAIGASGLGIQSKFVTKLPAKGPAELVRKVARANGVGTDDIVISTDGRVGLYFHEFGTPQRPANVTYDRFPSAFQTISPDEVDWERILEGGRIFHTSGITAALGKGPLETLRAGVEIAKSMGLTVSFDINYRSALWTPEECARTLRPIIEKVDILFTSLGDVRTVLGIDTSDPAKAFKDVAAVGIPVVAGVYNDPGFTDAPWVAQAYVRGNTIVDRRAFRLETVDRIGAGDAFAAGFLKGYLDDDLEAGLRYGNAMMALKNSMLGDYSWAVMDDVTEFLQGSGAMVKR